MEKKDKKLKNARVFIAGAGGFGSSTSFYLTVANIKRIRIVQSVRIVTTHSMKVKVKLFATFRELVGKRELEIELRNASDVYELLNTLFSSPDIREKIFNSDNKLKNHVIIVRNKRHINYFNGLSTKLEDGDEVAIFPPAGGG